MSFDTKKKYNRHVRLEPLFSEGLRFEHAALRVSDASRRCGVRMPIETYLINVLESVSGAA
jgi:hypothetical protein